MTDTTPNARFASQCAFCALTLTDAVSIDRGVGPECSKKYYKAPPQTEVDFATLGRALEGVEGLEDFALQCAVAGDAKEEGNTAKALEIAGKFDSRKLANELTARIAVEQTGRLAVHYTRALSALGFTTLADRIGARLGWWAMGVAKGTYTRSGRAKVALDPVATVTRRAAPVVRLERRPGFTPAQDAIVVIAPFSSEFNAARHRLGGRFDWADKTHVIPAGNEAALWAELAACFPGVDVVDGDSTVRLAPRDVYAAE